MGALQSKSKPGWAAQRRYNSFTNPCHDNYSFPRCATYAMSQDNFHPFCRLYFSDSGLFFYPLLVKTYTVLFIQRAMPWSFVFTQAKLGLDTMPLEMPTWEQRYYAIVREDNREDASLNLVAPRLLACSLNIRYILSHQLVAATFTSQILSRKPHSSRYVFFTHT